MTTIIISILAALGIGGGVMLASSGGGGSSSGGAAVVAPVNPGGNGGGSSNTGGNTGGTTSGGTNALASNSIPMVNSTVSFSGNNSSIKTGGILATAPATSTLASRISSANLKNGQMTMQLNLFAPMKVSGTTDTYTTNETFATTNSNVTFMSGFKQTDPPITASFDLTKQIAPTNYSKIGVDRYAGTSSASQSLTVLQFKYTGYKGEVSLGTFTNATWQVRNVTLFLGGRLLGLNNSDFGYIAWSSAFTHDDLDTRRGGKIGTQTFYIFDSTRQLKPSEYYNTSVSFAGNVVGKKHYIASCGNMGSSTYYIYGNINMTLDFATKQLTGALSNMKSSYDTSSVSNFGINPSFTGVINTDSSKPNFTITTISNNYLSMNSDGSFGQGVIIKGDSAAKDEIVGDLSFAYSNGSDFVNLSFGAKEQ